MTDQTTLNLPAATGWKRAEDGTLVWCGGMGAYYSDPGEAVKIINQRVPYFRCTESRRGRFSAACCAAKAQHDPDARGNPTKCGIHSRDAKARREAKREAAMDTWRKLTDAKGRLATAEAAVFKALRDVADGHQNPRNLARETLKELDAAKAYVKELSK